MAARLKDAGFSSLSVATMYMADKLERYPLDVQEVRYFRESTPLGTAGCVKQAAADVKHPFLVVSGDTVCDFDFSAIMEKHQKSGAAVSIVCTRVSTPTEYGTVLARDGFVYGFMEKGAWCQTLTNLVSTGIYVMNPSVLEYIGDGEQDFARNLFPTLLGAGVAIGCIEEKGYWCDIGDIESYYRCVFRTAGKASNVRFGGTVIADDAAVEGCVLFDGAVVESGAAVYDSIICENTVISRGGFVGSGCVIGGNTLIGEGAYITGGTALKNGLIVEKGARVMKSTVFGEIRKRHIEDGVISGRYGSYLGGELCLSLGGALAYTAGAGAAIGVMHGAGAESRALADSILCGIRLYGGRAYPLGDGFAAMAAFSAPAMGLVFSVMVEVNGSKARVQIFDADGLPPTNKELRVIESALSRPVPTAVTAGEQVELPPEESPRYLYARALVEGIGSLEGCTVYIGEKNPAAEFLYSVAEKRGAKAIYGKGDGKSDVFYVSSDGLYAEAQLGGSTDCGFWGLICIAAALGGEAALPTLTPDFVEQAVLRGGGKIRFYGETDSREREAVYRSMWCYDGNALALRALFAAKVAGKPLAALYEEMPKQVVECKTLRLADNNAAETIARLSSYGECGRGGEGVRLRYAKGSVTVVPISASAFRLYAEAVSTEAAAEIFSSVEEKIVKSEEQEK